MTQHDRPPSAEPVVTDPVVTVVYTPEELAVLASLLDIEHLPGVEPVELTKEARGLATRCLIARGVVVMPDDGGVLITQPHATLIAHLLDSDAVVQAAWITEHATVTASWFDVDDGCVHVADHDGLVAVAAHAAPARAAALAALGIEIDPGTPTDLRSEVMVELVTTTLRPPPAVTERETFARISNHWYEVSEVSR